MATKRKYTHGKTKDKKKFKKWVASSGQLQPDMSGFFVTCPRNKEKAAMGEIMDLLTEYADEMFPIADAHENEDDNNGEKDRETDEEKNDLDIEKSIQDELASLNAPKKVARIMPINLGILCIFFVKTRRPIKPTELVHRIFSDIFESRVKRTRYIQKISPCTKLCPAQLDRILEYLQDIIQGTPLSKDAPGISYSIEWRRRHHEVLHRDDVMPAVIKAIPDQHKAEFKNSSVHLIIELYKNVCGLSVVTDFEKYRKFNLREILSERELPSKPTQNGENMTTLSNKIIDENVSETIIDGSNENGENMTTSSNKIKDENVSETIIDGSTENGENMTNPSTKIKDENVPEIMIDGDDEKEF